MVLAFVQQPLNALRKPGRFSPGSLGHGLSVTFLENVMTKGLNFGVILLVSRALGPSDYGRFSFIFVTVALTSALFDFGMENTAVRFAARFRQQRESIFGLYLLVKLVILLALVLFFAVGGSVFFGWMGKTDLVQFMPYLLAGLIGESLFIVNDTWLQANRQFGLRAAINVARMAVAFLIVGLLTINRHLMLDAAMLVFWVPVLFSLMFLRRYVSFLRVFFAEKLMLPRLREIVDYERWMFVYAIANNLLGRVDFVMLGFWVGFAQLGIYNAAFQLCAVVSFLPLVLGKVLLPTLAEMPEKQIVRTTRRIIRATAAVCVIALLLVPLAPWVVPALLGQVYAEGVPVLQMLLLAFIAGLLTMPFEQALYGLGQPRIMSAGRYLQLAFIIALNFMVIPFWGIDGAAAATLAGRLLYLAFVRKCYHRAEREIDIPRLAFRPRPPAKERSATSRPLEPQVRIWMPGWLSGPHMRTAGNSYPEGQP